MFVWSINSYLRSSDSVCALRCTGTAGIIAVGSYHRWARSRSPFEYQYCFYMAVFGSILNVCAVIASRVGVWPLRCGFQSVSYAHLPMPDNPPTALTREAMEAPVPYDRPILYADAGAGLQVPRSGSDADELHLSSLSIDAELR